MRNLTRKTRWGLALLVACALLALAIPALAARLQASLLPPTVGMVCETGTLNLLGQREFSLRASTTRMITPDGNSILMWGYTDRGAGGAAELPGPTLCVNQGDEVVVNLTNDLAEPVSIIFPGQSGVTPSGGATGELTQEAAPGGSVTYTFTAAEPGSYMYESGTQPHKQVQMGLYGAIVVRPSLGAGYAYNDAQTAFDPQREYLLLFHEIDPYLHQAVEAGQTYDVREFHPRYWTINGRPFPDAIAPNGAAWLPDQPYGSLVVVEPAITGAQPALLRIANAGMASHPFHPHGNDHRVIAHDGRLLGDYGSGTSTDGSNLKFTITVGPGQTYDALFQWQDVGDLQTADAVSVPQLQNQVFEGTWYSGSPYLGQQGDLPVDTTMYNECGEYYFMWHSHAAFEIGNWDGGPGGMITWLRVDPPGGCP